MLRRARFTFLEIGKRQEQARTSGCSGLTGSRGAGLAMAHRLLLLAERSWRRLDGHELLPLVRAGMQFKDGVRVEREDDQVPVFAKERPTVNTGKRGKIAA